MVAASGTAAVGDVPTSARALGDLLRMDETLVILQREAVQKSNDFAPDLFGGSVPADWEPAITELFDPAAARAQFDVALAEAMEATDPADFAAAYDFFSAPLGQRLLELELSAREAILNPDVEAAAKQSWADHLADPLPASAQRVRIIQDIVDGFDQINANVSAALNGNLAFYEGLAQAGLVEGMTSEDILGEVMAQEGEVRAEIEDWLYPYLALAYASLSDDEMRDYIAFAVTRAGQALNAAMFRAFDALGAVQSRGMGLAAGRLMMGQDI